MTPIPIPETGADLAWERVATFGGAPNVFVGDLAKGPGGYVAVGERIDGVITELGNDGPTAPLIWRSTDGITWVPGDASAFGGHVATSLAGDGAQYLAVVPQDAGGGLMYRSVDGIAWEVIADAPGATSGYLRKVIQGPAGFVAIGWSEPSHPAFWASATGTDWTITHQESDGSEPYDVVSGPRGVVAVGSAQAAQPGPGIQAVWYSVNGQSWERRDPDSVGAGSLERVLATPSGFVAGGWVDGLGIVLWRSGDGQKWVPLPAQTALGPDVPGDSGSIREAFLFAGAEYVTGYVSCCGNPPQHTFVSADGAYWARVHRDEAVVPVHFGPVIAEVDRVVATGVVLGSGGLGETGGIWIGRAP
jgi:hypothetical protein